MPESKFSKIIGEIFTAPTQDSRIIIEHNKINVKRKERGANKYSSVSKR
jgi:hypothetical protein